MTISRTRTATSSAPTTVVIAVIAAIAMAALVAALAPIEPAAAHAAYASSTPAFAEVLDDGPESLELRFSQELFRRAGANTMRLERAADSASIGLGRSGSRMPSAPRCAPICWRRSKPVVTS